MSVTVTVQGTITAIDSAVGTIPFSKQLSVVMNGLTFSETQSQLVGTSPTTLALPTTPAQFVYIKNLAATGSVAVTWTPQGGASAVTQNLSPGQALLFLNSSVGPAIAGVSPGISALSVTASAASTPIEYMIGG